MSQLKDSAVVSLNNNDDRGRREFANPLAAAFESTDDVGSKDDGMVEVRSVIMTTYRVSQLYCFFLGDPGSDGTRDL